MKPASERIAISNGSRSSGENEKRRLKGIFREMRVAEKPPADAQYHRPVPFHQRGESCLRDSALARRVSVKQLPIREHTMSAGLEERANLFVEADFWSASRHRPILALVNLTPRSTNSLRPAPASQVPILRNEGFEW
jgi:hypothetical protein